MTDNCTNNSTSDDEDNFNSLSIFLHNCKTERKVALDITFRLLLYYFLFLVYSKNNGKFSIEVFKECVKEKPLPERVVEMLSFHFEFPENENFFDPNYWEESIDRIVTNEELMAHISQRFEGFKKMEALKNVWDSIDEFINSLKLEKNNDGFEINI